MKREELLNKMIACYDTCVLNLQYPHDKAMDRVLEIIEEELELELDSDDNYCGAV